MPALKHIFFYFFFNDTATTEIYTLSLHDALPISHANDRLRGCVAGSQWVIRRNSIPLRSCKDRKSTRLNSSHTVISYAVFCLKKKTMTCATMLWIWASTTIRLIIVPEWGIAP